MKNFLSILGMIALVIFAFSFSDSGVMVTKPATPRQTAFLTVDTFGNHIEQSKADLLKYAKAGWIVSETITNGQSDRVIVVLVKY
jgi:hypothetical protein